MHASTLQILEKRFAAEDARAIAEAIEEETGPSRLVTNESLKAQLAELEARLFTQIAALGLSGAGLIVTATFFLVLNLRK